jgi:signal transduction histidine kinase
MFLKFLNRLRKTIGFRLALWSSAIFILGFLSLFAFSYFYFSSSIRKYEKETVQLELSEYQAQYEKGGMKGLQKEADFERQITGHNPFFVRLAGPDDKTLFLTIPDSWIKFDLKQLEKRYTHPKKRWLSLRMKDDQIEIASRRLLDGYLLQVGKSSEKRQYFLRRFQHTFAGILVPLILISFTGGVFLAYRMLRPIRDLIDTLQSIIRTGEMDVRAPTRQTGDEFDELIGLFNGMLEKIRILITGIRNSLDNVAHDLRTPMTRLQGIVEMALQSEQKAAALREALIECKEESEQILRMLNTLMDISEAETGTMKLHLEEVDIQKVVEDAVDLYTYVAEEKNISIHAISTNGLSLTADRSRLREVLANLLDNAIKYTPTGGRVDVDVFQRHPYIAVIVKDNGIGVPPEELPRIWDRLYRGDKSRSQRGLGLGLSLVKAIVRAHQGYVEATSEPGMGSVFTIYLPKSLQ